MAGNKADKNSSEAKPVKKRALRTSARKDVKNGKTPQPKKRVSRKKKIIFGVVGVVIFLIILAGMPRTGTIRYGLCKTFIELNDPYPESLEFVQAVEDGNNVFVDYIKVDGFGQRTLNQTRCFFKDDPVTHFKLDRVDVNGKNSKPAQEDPAVIAKFNAGILALIANKPDLTLPYGLPEDIEDFKQ